MESKANYTLVGLFVVVVGLAVIIAAFWLSAGFTHKSYKTYELYLNEAVVGLNVRAPVRFNGVDIGYVSNIELNNDDLQQVRVILEIESDVPITTATLGSLYLQGITGVTYIGLRTTESQAPLLKAKPGKKYPVIDSEISFLVTLEDTMLSMSEDMTSLSNSFSTIFDGDNIDKLTSTISNVEAFSQALGSRSEEISTIIDNLSQASTDLPAMIHRMDEATNSLAITMSSGQNAIQNLSDQAVPSLIDLLTRLNTMSHNLEQLSNDLNADPSVIVRGKVASSPGPGER